jgi:hypothetical protein
MGLFDFLQKKEEETTPDSLSADDALDEFSKVEKQQNESDAQFAVDLQNAILKLAQQLGENIQEDLDQFVPKGEFGYEETNPVMVTTLAESYYYLNRLECINGDPIEYSRIGSMSSSVVKRPMDVYNVKNARTGETLRNIYIYGYGKKLSMKTPKGFRFK